MLWLVWAQKPCGQDPEKIVFWLQIPALSGTNMAGLVTNVEMPQGTIFTLSVRERTVTKVFGSSQTFKKWMWCLLSCRL